MFMRFGVPCFAPEPEAAPAASLDHGVGGFDLSIRERRSQSCTRRFLPPANGKPVARPFASAYPRPVLRQSATALAIDTVGRGLFEITRPVAAWVAELGAQSGLVTLFIRHTSAGLLIQENAAPEVRADLDRFFARLVAGGDPIFRHRDEGFDDMPAHVRTALTAVQLSIPVVDSRL